MADRCYIAFWGCLVLSGVWSAAGRSGFALVWLVGAGAALAASVIWRTP